ncbi:putative ATPase, AAA-type, core, P-loop containing nucleoside triphosphate hydrolase [Medicago truncatula]|uniref:Putative ATPase, AAA-type, core, P-loop containing nucleoside triphosphate hydrolase n=1 Tax=Medicago truncatula TaxID=3880 RepID=A0A396IK27_MEDTR|nr:putative ATPase, AAA-type, core, P-loop containing nucleoside triphosphate hydrolase [Medicago truncatula]
MFVFLYLFSKAKRTAPSIIFIDEIDAIASKRENSQRQTETRIVTQLLTCMEEACNSVNSDEPTGYVLVIGATNRLDAIDSALRRPGRFAREILVGIPDESAREEILFVHTRKRSDKFDASVDLQKIARATSGFVGGDLEALVGKAGELALERIINERNRKSSKDLMSEPNIVRWKKTLSPQEINKFAIKMSDFEEAIKMVQPSLTREGFSPIPDVKWEDVGALDDARENFDSNILMRIKEPEIYEGLGLDRDTGFLLYGPPGCGKTLIAKAVANEAGANFIYIKGPELLNKYVGESEREVRKLFDRARACAPCILFFDEVDALTSKHGNEGSRVIDGVLKQLLIELEGAEQRKGVFVIGATDRPLEMDKAVLRPGRFGNHIYISLPSPDGRVSILKALARSKEALARRKETHARFKLMPIDASVDLSAIGRSKACENYSGADLAALMDKAILAALEEKLATTARTSDTLTVERKHFYVALTKVHPSVSEKVCFILLNFFHA